MKRKLGSGCLQPAPRVSAGPVALMLPATHRAVPAVDRCVSGPAIRYRRGCAGSCAGDPPASVVQVACDRLHRAGRERRSSGSAVVRVGGVVTGDLSIIRAVGAALDDRELEALRASDSRVCASSKTHRCNRAQLPVCCRKPTTRRVAAATCMSVGDRRGFHGTGVVCRRASLRTSDETTPLTPRPSPTTCRCWRQPPTGSWFPAAHGSLSSIAPGESSKIADAGHPRLAAPRSSRSSSAAPTAR